MIRTYLVATATLLATGVAAFAADLPPRQAPPVYVEPAPVFSWTGFYAGGQIGFGFGEDRASGGGLYGGSPAVAATPGTPARQDGNLIFPGTPGTPGRAAIPGRPVVGSGFARPNGIIGGAHVGYNLATQTLPLLGGGLGGGGLVIGVEGDIDGTDYRGTIGLAQLREQIQGSARGRLGIAVDRALFYVTGGAAFAQFQTSYGLPAALGGFQTGSTTRVGYTVGGGVEYAITTQWSLRAEYRYSDFGSFRDGLGAVSPAVTRRETMQRAQVGFSYKFDTPVVPVVARY